MATEENLGRKLDQVNKNAQYDSCAKRLLGERIVLAFILKYAVPEFADCAIEDIRSHYIEGIEIAQRGVDVDETNVGTDFDTKIAATSEGSEIIGENVESATKTEGKIVYDIIFSAIAPATGKPIRLIINIEAQKSDPSHYELITRGVYYCSRMLSAQKGRIFQRSEYQKMQKVYSIWVCMNPSAERRNTMNMYPIVEQNIIGGYKADKRAYDLASVVTINLDAKVKSEQPILNFLEILLSNAREPAEKKRELLDEYGIETTPEMEKEMDEMCNLSKGIAEENRAAGAENILTLMQKLFAAGRDEDVKKAANDKAFCAKLLAEFGLA